VWLGDDRGGGGGTLPPSLGFLGQDLHRAADEVRGVTREAGIRYPWLVCRHSTNSLPEGGEGEAGKDSNSRSALIGLDEREAAVARRRNTKSAGRPGRAGPPRLPYFAAAFGASPTLSQAAIFA